MLHVKTFQKKKIKLSITLHCVGNKP